MAGRYLLWCIPFVRISPQKPARILVFMRKEGDGTWLRRRAQEVEFLLVSFERNGEVAIHSDCGAGRAAEVEDRPVAGIGDDESARYAHKHSEEPALQSSPHGSAFPGQAGFHYGAAACKAVLPHCVPDERGGELQCGRHHVNS